MRRVLIVAGLGLSPFVVAGIISIILAAVFAPKDVLVPVLGERYLPGINDDQRRRLYSIILGAEPYIPNIQNLHRQISFSQNTPNFKPKPILDPDSISLEDVVTRFYATGDLKFENTRIRIEFNFIQLVDGFGDS